MLSMLLLVLYTAMTPRVHDSFLSEKCLTATDCIICDAVAGASDTHTHPYVSKIEIERVSKREMNG